MKFYILHIALFVLFFKAGILAAQAPTSKNDSEMMRKIYDFHLSNDQCYENLRYLATKIGGRLSGSPQAAAAVEWARQTLMQLQPDTVYLQPVMVPHWVRGDKEEARLVSTLYGTEPLNVCALGGSVATPLWGLSAPVLLINDLSELEKMDKKAVQGKIVFLNKAMDDKEYDTFHAYSHCSGNRYRGAPLAARMGAVAFVIRSLTTAIDEFPHTGGMGYEENVPRIPAFAIATLHANLLSGILSIDPNLRLYLRSNCQNLPDELSYNVIAELKGSKKPEQIMVVSGHLDAWDNGQGAHDDGAGVVQSIDVLRAFKALKQQPQHTLRCVLYMNEENGAKGAIEYARIAQAKNEKHLVAIESDRGAFAPEGFEFDHADTTLISKRLARLQTWKPLFAPYHVHWFEQGFAGVDINKLKDQQIDLMGYTPDSQRYFDYHHTANDTFDKINRRELSLGSATISSIIYLIDKYEW
jgi:carboxypeptidase Q